MRQPSFTLSAHHQEHEAPKVTVAEGELQSHMERFHIHPMSRSQSHDPNLLDKLGRKCTGIYVWRSDHQQLCFSLLYISQYPFVPLPPQKPVLSTPKESTSSPLDLASSPGSLGDMQVSIKSGCGCSWPRHQ